MLIHGDLYTSHIYARYCKKYIGLHMSSKYTIHTI